MGEDLESRVRRKLQADGLLPYLVNERSQFLDFPSGYFLELVVKDGAKLPEFRRAVDEIRAQVPEKLDVIVRAVWEVSNVGGPIQAYSMQTGSPRAATQYPVDLKSGGAVKRIWVEVTYLADKMLEEHGAEKTEDVKGIVEEFVVSQLKKGGASYWDPEQFPVLEINSNTASFIVSGALPGWTKRPAV
ncbi:MAG: hypothetical protein ABSD98_13690 [Candidatus Korobacteraceae bacterium]|jgi:hypothetical protein